MYKRGVPFSEFTKEDVDKFRTNFIRSVLRNASIKWPARYLAEKKARVGYGQYRCSACRRIIRASERKLDHIHPVVDPAKGFEGWDVYIERLFTYVEGWQVLCSSCHEAKTNEEKKAAAVRRKEEKKKSSPKAKKEAP